MELGSYCLFLQEQIKDIIIIKPPGGNFKRYPSPGGNFKRYPRFKFEYI